jgi:hypothetical protein
MFCRDFLPQLPTKISTTTILLKLLVVGPQSNILPSGSSSGSVSCKIISENLENKKTPTIIFVGDAA